MTSDNDLIFLPLGGSGEIGMNMNLYGLGPAHARRWIMIDCGVTFGDHTSPGIDLITPDPAFILDEITGAAKLDGLILTHGHEDHIGAVATLWPFLKCPIYATAFTAALVERKFQEKGIIGYPMNIIEMGSRHEVGLFDFEMVTLTHSIPEPSGVILRTPHGTVLHTGDWKIDPDPSLGPLTDSAKLRALGDDGVIAMVCDSTNVLSAGESGSEARVRDSLIELIGKQKGRVAVTTFASNVGRLVSICEAAIANERSICLLGRSMFRMMDVAREVEILPPNIKFVEPEEAGFLPRENTLYLCTGSQGEGRAALARIARDDHRDLVLNEGDTVIFSSKIIPGNERTIYDLQNQLVDNGVYIITEKDEFVHVSGHPCRDELAKMYDWVKPDLSIPVHGEARHLEEHAKFAKQQGVKQAIAPRNGKMIRIAPGKPKIIDEVPVGRLYVDGHVLLRQGNGVMKERHRLAEGGHITIAIALGDRNDILAPPEVNMRGVPPEDMAGISLQELLEDAVEDAMDNMPKPRRGDDDEITRVMRKAVRGALEKRWGKRSDISVMVLRS
ncbi:MAG: ribonuclease J [Parvularculaceae bacterium]